MPPAHFKTIEERIGGAVGDKSATWKDFEWIVKQTKLPVIAKGILTGAF